MIPQELSRKGGGEDSLRALVGTGWICKLSAMGCGCPSVGTGWALFCKPFWLPSLSASAVGHPIFPQGPPNPRILTLGPACRWKSSGEKCRELSGPQPASLLQVCPERAPCG